MVATSVRSGHQEFVSNQDGPASDRYVEGTIDTKSDQILHQLNQEVNQLAEKEATSFSQSLGGWRNTRTCFQPK